MKWSFKGNQPGEKIKDFPGCGGRGYDIHLVKWKFQVGLGLQNKSALHKRGWGGGGGHFPKLHIWNRCPSLPLESDLRSQWKELTFVPHIQQLFLEETGLLFPEDSKDNSSTGTGGVGTSVLLLFACCLKFSSQMDDQGHNIAEYSNQCLKIGRHN